VHHAKYAKSISNRAKNSKTFRRSQPYRCAKKSHARIYVLHPSCRIARKVILQLQSEVAHLHEELHRTNAELQRTLEENTRVRAYLSRVLESLPCGILVVDAHAQTQIINPEARRLLAVSPDWPGGGPSKSTTRTLQKQFEIVPANSFFSEQEWLAPETPADRSVAILRANVSESMNGYGDTIWIIRDITEQKRLASERESARSSRALAEVAAVLAHEMRNPLGSMELFAGLLADATAQMPETRERVTHLQAGLRTLSFTKQGRGQCCIPLSVTAFARSSPSPMSRANIVFAARGASSKGTNSVSGSPKVLCIQVPRETDDLNACRASRCVLAGACSRCLCPRS
jgi:hypothetical protein